MLYTYPQSLLHQSQYTIFCNFNFIPLIPPTYLSTYKPARLIVYLSSCVSTNLSDWSSLSADLSDRFPICLSIRLIVYQTT